MRPAHVDDAASNSTGTVLRLGYYAVAVLDVLGLKARFERLPYPATEAEMEKVRPIIEETFGVVNRVRRKFPPAFEQWNKVGLAGSNSGSPAIKSYSFADTVVAYTPVHVEPTGVLGVMGLIVTCATAHLRCLAQGIPIRGGIEVDWAGEYERDPANILGPVLIKAHSLEESVAKWPRVVAGGGLMSYLRALSTDASEEIRTIAQRCALNTVQDIVDGISIVDCVGPTVRDLLEPDLDMRDQIVRARDFLDSEQRRFCRNGNAKLAARYALSLAHFVESLQRLDQEVRGNSGPN